VFPIKDERTFEDWIINRFGLRLYKIFFKTYTEKVWGTPCNQISAEWAAQRIKGLSLKTALIHALVGQRSKSRQGVIKTLINAFHYPKRGPGMMWEEVARELEDNGHKVLMNANVTRIQWSRNAVTTLEVDQGEVCRTITAPYVISSMPIRELIEKLDPAPPLPVQKAADSLKYRDFITVAVVVDEAEVFPDNWIYVHDNSVKVGRIQNFKNWSPHMVPDSSKTCLGLEYFCFEGDGLWTMSDEDLLELATDELQAIGLVNRSKVEDGTVVRTPKAYPVYDNTYGEALRIVRQFLDDLKNLQLVGRNGMHKYNNQDHSMLTAMLAVENILGADHDLWSVNVEQEYHEELTAEDVERSQEYAALAANQPRVPEALATYTLSDEALIRTFARLDKAAFATAIGSVSGALVGCATIWLLLLYEPGAGAYLQLLSQYFYGYTVTYTGAMIGFAHAFLWGFTFGWVVAYLRNLMLGLYVSFIVHRARSFSVNRLLDYI
jgi:protoporphyrinogen oxidase